MDASANSDAEPRPGARVPAGWYPVADVPSGLRWWDGEQFVGPPVVRQRGWYDLPAEPGVRRFWDGRRWTSEKGRRASGCAVGVMLALTAAGVGLVVWGWRVATAISGGFMTETSEHRCENAGVLVPTEQLWAIWLALVAVSGAALVTWRRVGVGDGRLAWMARLGAISTVALFPLWLPILSILDGMNCGL